MSYWLNSKDKLEHPEEYDADVRAICETYATAPSAPAVGSQFVTAMPEGSAKTWADDEVTRKTSRSSADEIPAN